MKLPLLSLPVVVLLISLLFSWTAILVQTQTMTETRETRKSALMETLSRSQFEDGSFPDFLFLSSNQTSGDHVSTARVLHITKTLNMLDAIDSERAMDYIISKQNQTLGNLTLWNWPGFMGDSAQDMLIEDPYVVYTVSNTLVVLDVLGKANKTAILSFALSRYNESDGAFHEPIIRFITSSYQEREMTVNAFPLDFHANMDLAYARSNIISTFLGVSILANLDALNMINTTKTLNWILSCEGANGAFKPFPESQPEYLPGWSSLITNPFYVDRYGTGIAYTYAALGTLKALGVNVKDVVDIKKITDYVLASQQPYPYDTVRFLAHPDDSHSPFFDPTYYAMMTLHYIGALGNETEVSSKVSAYILKFLQDPYLRFEDSWPVPTRLRQDWYGLFIDFPPSRATDFSVSILNITNKLNVLDEPTPIVSKTWSNLTILSIIASSSTTGLAIIGILSYRTVQTRKQRKELPTSEKDAMST